MLSTFKASWLGQPPRMQTAPERPVNHHRARAATTTIVRMMKFLSERPPARPTTQTNGTNTVFKVHPSQHHDGLPF